MSAAITQKSLAAARKAVAGGASEIALRDDEVAGLSLVIGRRSDRWRLEYKRPLPGGGWSGGKRVVLGDLGTMTPEDARAAARAMKKQVSLGLDPAEQVKAKRAALVEQAATQTVADAVTRYIDEREADWAISTRREFHALLGKLIAALGPVPMAQVTRGDLVKLVVDEADRLTAAGKSETHVPNKLATLVASVWAQAGRGSRKYAGWEWPQVDPYLAVNLPVRGRHRVTSRSRILTHDEIRTAWQKLGTLPGMVPHALKASLATGLRIGGVCQLQVSDLDLDHESGPVLRLRAGEGTKASAAERRDGTSQILPLSPFAASIFRQALRLGKGSPHVFPAARSDGPLPPRYCAQLWGGAALVPGATVHDLRRTARSEMGALPEPDLSDRLFSESQAIARERRQKSLAAINKAQRALQSAAEALDYDVDRHDYNRAKRDAQRFMRKVTEGRATAAERLNYRPGDDFED